MVHPDPCPGACRPSPSNPITRPWNQPDTLSPGAQLPSLARCPASLVSLEQPASPGSVQTRANNYAMSRDLPSASKWGLPRDRGSMDASDTSISWLVGSCLGNEGTIPEPQLPAAAQGSAPPHAPNHIGAHMQAYLYMYPYLDTCTLTSAHTHTPTCMRTHLRAHIHTHAHPLTRACTHSYVHTHTCTLTHACPPTASGHVLHLADPAHLSVQCSFWVRQLWGFIPIWEILAGSGSVR